MYKNFSYIFGLGALLLLAACNNGDEKATNGKQKANEPQKLTHIQNEETEPVKEISSKDQTKSATKGDDIYADINKPIESDLSSWEVKGDIEADNTVNIEELKTEEDVTVPPHNKKPVANTESASEITVDSTPESNTEKRTQEKDPKVEKTQPTDIVNNELKNEEVQSAEALNNVETSIAAEVPAVAANEENTENLGKTPEVSVESEVPVISEEPVENKSSAEVSLDSEPTPVMDEAPAPEVVSESEPAPVMDEAPVPEVVSKTKN